MNNSPMGNYVEDKTMKFDLNSMLSAPVAAAGTTAIKEIPIDMLVPYGKHPFTLYSGERLDDMVQSVKANGILTPILVRELNGKYEILAGHNRTNAAKIAGLTTVPAVVKTGISDEEADMYVIETNLMQRGFKDLLISERAAVVAHRHSKMFDEKKLAAIQDELSAINNQQEEAKPDSKLAQIGEEYGLSKNTIARLIRVNKLLTSCEKYKTAVDASCLSVRAAVELSYVPAAALEAIFNKYADSIVINNVWCESVKIDIKLAERLREMFEEFDGNVSDAELVLKTMQKCDNTEKKPKQYKVKSEILAKYFDEEENENYINDIVDQALAMYFEMENS